MQPSHPPPSNQLVPRRFTQPSPSHSALPDLDAARQLPPQPITVFQLAISGEELALVRMWGRMSLLVGYGYRAPNRPPLPARHRGLPGCLSETALIIVRELVRHDVPPVPFHAEGVIYAIFLRHPHAGEPVRIYVGRTIGTALHRFSQHLRSAFAPAPSFRTGETRLVGFLRSHGVQQLSVVPLQEVMQGALPEVRGDSHTWAIVSPIYERFWIQVLRALFREHSHQYRGLNMLMPGGRNTHFADVLRRAASQVPLWSPLLSLVPGGLPAAAVEDTARLFGSRDYVRRLVHLARRFFQLGTCLIQAQHALAHWLQTTPLQVAHFVPNVRG